MSRGNRGRGRGGGGGGGTGSPGPNASPRGGAGGGRGGARGAGGGVRGGRGGSPFGTPTPTPGSGSASPAGGGGEGGGGARWVNRGGGFQGFRGRGRGRGGFAKTDHTNAAFDYGLLDAAKLGYDTAPTPPSFTYVGVPPKSNPSSVPSTPQASNSTSGGAQLPLPSHFLPPTSSILKPPTPAYTPPGSGTSTPHFGIGSAGDRFAHHSQQPLAIPTPTPIPSAFANRGRGGARGGARGGFSPFASHQSSYHGPDQSSWGSEQRPLLRPIKFVPSTVILPPTSDPMEGAEVTEEIKKSEDWDPTPSIGEKVFVVFEKDGEGGQTGLEGKEVIWGVEAGESSTGPEKEETKQFVPQEMEGQKIEGPATPKEEEMQVFQESTTVETKSDNESLVATKESPPSPDPIPTFIFDSNPAPISLSASTPHPKTSILGITPASSRRSELAALESDSDDEQIVFMAPGASTSPKVASITPLPQPPTSSLGITAKEVQPAAEPSDATAAASKVAVPPPKKLSKGQKRQLKKEGKKARKNGRKHTRSGNGHLFAEAPTSSGEEEGGEDDEAEGAAMLSRMNLDSTGMEVDVDSSDSSDEDDNGVRKPRMDDSDLDWGDDGPPPPSSSGKFLPTGKARRQERKQTRLEQKERDKMERLAGAARRDMELALQMEEDEMMEGTGQGVVRGKGKMQEVKSRRQLAEEDYEENVRQFIEEEGLDSAALQFASNVHGDQNGQQDTIEDLEADARRADTQWNTTDESDSDSGKGSEAESEEDNSATRDYKMGERDARDEMALARASDSDDSYDSDELLTDSDEDEMAIEEALLSGQKIRFSSQGKAGAGGRRDRRARRQAALVEEDSDDEDGEMFTGGKKTWADKDEDYISGVQRIIEENADLLGSRDRKARKLLFKAINQGDFEGYDFEDDNFGLTKQRSKTNKGPKTHGGTSDSHFVDQLQDQWEKDRAKKASFKRDRAIARAEAAAAAIKAKSKSKGKARATDTSSYVDEGVVNAHDAGSIHRQIYHFVAHQQHLPTLALPPMSKKMRVAVHLLSEEYGLKSDSKGKGDLRFPILKRTVRTTYKGVDQRQIEFIIGTAGGEGGSSGKRVFNSAKSGSLWKAFGVKKGGGGGGGGGGGAGKNHEGAVVGQGADKIGEGNIGFALLKKMGWTEGGQIGVSGGMMDPIVARVKTGKQGLGSGFVVSRAEAQILGTAATDGWH